MVFVDYFRNLDGKDPKFCLKEETKNMTVIMVSQRVGTVRYADKIIVLDKGELVGIGKHNDLFNECSVYKEICLSQLKAEEVLNK